MLSDQGPRMPGFGKLESSIRCPFFHLAQPQPVAAHPGHLGRPDAILTHLDLQRTAHISTILDLAIQAQKTFWRDGLFRSVALTGHQHAHCGRARRHGATVDRRHLVNLATELRTKVGPAAATIEGMEEKCRL
jgi:hypothetical protein